MVQVANDDSGRMALATLPLMLSLLAGVFSGGGHRWAAPPLTAQRRRQGGAGGVWQGAGWSQLPQAQDTGHVGPLLAVPQRFLQGGGRKGEGAAPRRTQPEPCWVLKRASCCPLVVRSEPLSLRLGLAWVVATGCLLSRLITKAQDPARHS